MAPIEFKLSKAFESTRRVSFPEPPSWSTLASKISFLYDVPAHNIGASYIDRDGDEITLSSDQEIQDYYATSWTPGKAIKFTVVDLGVRNAQQTKSLPDTPRMSGGTFGENVPMMFNEAEDDWQRIPGFSGLGMFPGLRTQSSDDGPHAFLEVIPSDASSHAHDDRGSDASTDSDLGELIEATIGKGKERATDQHSAHDGDSVISLLADEEPKKLPIHVARGPERSAQPTTIPRPASPSARSTYSEATAIPNNAPSEFYTAIPMPSAESERAHSPAPSRRSSAAPVAQRSSPVPPPPINEAQNTPAHAAGENATASLYNDLATFLTTAATVFAQHPELSEGVRNIINHATNGTYLNGYRDTAAQATAGMRQFAEGAASGASHQALEFQRSMQQAQAEMVQAATAAREDALRSAAEIVRGAAELQQSQRQVQEAAARSTEDIRRAAEEQASRRVTDALGGIFRAFVRPEDGSAAGAAQARISVGQTSTARPHPPPSARYSHGWEGHRFAAPAGAPPTTQTLPRPRPASRSNVFDIPVGRIVHEPPAVPIPPPPIQSAPWLRAPAPAPRPRAPPAPVPRPLTPPAPSRGPLTPPAPSRGPYQGPVARPSAHPNPPVAPAPPAVDKRETTRAELDAAKRAYQEAKERYRRDRDDRKMRGQNISGDSAMQSADSQDSNHRLVQPKPTPATTNTTLLPTPRVNENITLARTGSRSGNLVSNARGPFPRMEMVNVSGDNRRSSIVVPDVSHRSGSRRVTPTGESSNPVSRVKRRLLDMGFPETRYPTLPTMINMHLRSAPEPTQAEEEEIVTKLIEELLSFTPPRPSGSGSRRQL